MNKQLIQKLIDYAKFSGGSNYIEYDFVSYAQDTNYETQVDITIDLDELEEEIQGGK